MPEIRYEDLPIIFQSDGAVKDEIDQWTWNMLITIRMIETYIPVGGAY